MIHEIFITDLSYKVLYGNPRVFAQNFDVEKLGVFDEIPPVLMCKDKKMSNMRINDVILFAYYCSIDAFTISKYLFDLKLGLESRISCLNAQSIKDNYFIILKHIHDYDLAIPNRLASSALPVNIIGTENVYIDVIQEIHTLIASDGSIIKNDIHGKILHSDSNFKMEVESSSCRFKNDHKKKDNLFEIICDKKDPIPYYCNSFNQAIFKMHKVGGVYTFESNFKEKFEFVEFIIPVGKNTYSVDAKSSTGNPEFDMKNGCVKWRFQNKHFTKETIKISKRSLEEEDVYDSIIVNFLAEPTTAHDMTVKKCNHLEKHDKKYWVKYILKSGYYEIRQ